MKLCDVVRETAFAIHRYHKHGHLEKACVLSRIGQGVGTVDLPQRCSPFLRFLRLFAANPTGFPQCAPPPGPNITGCNAFWSEGGKAPPPMATSMGRATFLSVNWLASN